MESVPFNRLTCRLENGSSANCNKVPQHIAPVNPPPSLHKVPLLACWREAPELFRGLGY